MAAGWTQLPVSTVWDVAALARHAPDPGEPITIARQDGTVWRSTDRGASFTPTTAEGFRRVAAAPDGSMLWAVGDNGSVWYTSDLEQWLRVEELLSTPIADVAIDFDNGVWLVAKNGALLKGSHTVVFAPKFSCGR